MCKFEIRLIQSQNEKEEMYYQRWLVLRSPINMPRGTEKDEYDDTALHLIVVLNHQIIGSARLRELSTNLGSISYVSVLAKFQSQGVGTALVKRLIKIAQEKHFKSLRVMTRINALRFYRRIGFLETGEPFNFLGIPHQFMCFNLLSSENPELNFQQSPGQIF